jgi:hypothetical protein
MYPSTIMSMATGAEHARSATVGGGEADSSQEQTLEIAFGSSSTKVQE